MDDKGARRMGQRSLHVHTDTGRQITKVRVTADEVDIIYLDIKMSPP